MFTFKPVNVREINAFALPGGPMYVNRGMIEAAKTEGEVVGVMAHELSHVVLRHGTAQASQATKYEVGAIAGAVRRDHRRPARHVVSEGSRFGLGTYFLRFSRDFERQADIQGVQLMARAGRGFDLVCQSIAEQPPRPPRPPSSSFLSERGAVSRCARCARW